MKNGYGNGITRSILIAVMIALLAGCAGNSVKTDSDGSITYRGPDAPFVLALQQQAAQNEAKRQAAAQVGEKCQTDLCRYLAVQEISKTASLPTYQPRPGIGEKLLDIGGSLLKQALPAYAQIVGTKERNETIRSLSADSVNLAGIIADGYAALPGDQSTTTTYNVGGNFGDTDNTNNSQNAGGDIFSETGDIENGGGHRADNGSLIGDDGRINSDGPIDDNSNRDNTNDSNNDNSDSSGGGDDEDVGPDPDGGRPAACNGFGPLPEECRD